MANIRCIIDLSLRRATDIHTGNQNTVPWLDSGGFEPTHGLPRLERYLMQLTYRAAVRLSGWDATRFAAVLARNNIEAQTLADLQR
jgi:hypothetical protein